MLGTYGSAATPRLIRIARKVKRDEEARGAMEGLGLAARSDKKARAFLVKVLVSQHPKLKSSAYAALLELGAPALPLLKKAYRKVRDKRLRRDIERLVEAIKARR